MLLVLLSKFPRRENIDMYLKWSQLKYPTAVMYHVEKTAAVKVPRYGPPPTVRQAEFLDPSRLTIH